LWLDVQIKFFDESINAKLNRAKTQLVKKETPFLDDSTDQVRRLPHSLSVGRHGSKLVIDTPFPGSSLVINTTFP
jgi:hypothetical protein